MEKEIIKILEDPNTRKLFEDIAEKAILEYAHNTGYHI